MQNLEPDIAATYGRLLRAQQRSKTGLFVWDCFETITLISPSLNRSSLHWYFCEVSNQERAPVCEVKFILHWLKLKTVYCRF